ALDDAGLATVAATAIEHLIVGGEPRHDQSGGHTERLPDLAGLGIDATDFALFVLPCAVPQLAMFPSHTGHEPVRLERPQDLAGLGVDLEDLAVVVLADPQRSFGPRHARTTAVAGSRDARDDLAAGRIDLVDAGVHQLIEVLAVEGGPRVGCDVERTLYTTGRRIERDQARAGRHPQQLPVEGHTVD